MSSRNLTNSIRNFKSEISDTFKSETSQWVTVGMSVIAVWIGVAVYLSVSNKCREESDENVFSKEKRLVCDHRYIPVIVLPSVLTLVVLGMWVRNMNQK